jgi:hypothetical protein
MLIITYFSWLIHLKHIINQALICQYIWQKKVDFSHRIRIIVYIVNKESNAYERITQDGPCI